MTTVKSPQPIRARIIHAPMVILGSCRRPGARIRPWRLISLTLTRTNPPLLMVTGPPNKRTHPTITPLRSRGDPHSLPSLGSSLKHRALASRRFAASSQSGFRGKGGGHDVHHAAMRRLSATLSGARASPRPTLLRGARPGGLAHPPPRLLAGLSRHPYALYERQSRPTGPPGRRSPSCKEGRVNGLSPGVSGIYRLSAAGGGDLAKSDAWTVELTVLSRS